MIRPRKLCSMNACFEKIVREPTSIIVDDREPESVTAALKVQPDCHVSIQRLSLGDYQVDDRLLFERKTLPDFAASVMDGRLFY